MSTYIPRAALRTLTAICLLTVSGTAFGQDAFFDYPRSGDYLLIDYSQTHAKVAEADRVNTIQVFGDGVVRMHRPFWQIDGGDFTARLDDAELQSLLDALLAGGAFHFDAAAVRQKCGNADKARLAAEDIELYNSEDTRIQLRIRVASFQSKSSPYVEGPIEHLVEWRNLEWSAEHYPHIGELEDLLAAEKSLHELWRRTDLQKQAEKLEVAR